MPKQPSVLTSTDFERAHYKLFEELALLHSAWDEYQYLFNGGNARVEILNICAGWFFGLTQRVLVANILMSISRLTDPPIVGRHEHLTISALLTDPALKGKVKARTRLERRVAMAVLRAKPIRLHRNSYIAHLDHALMVGKVASSTVPRLPLVTITKAVTALEAAYNEHGGSMRGSSTDFELKSLHSASKLLAILESSERWQWWKAANDANPAY